MRKRNWTLTPWFIIFSVIMFAMAVVSYDYSPVVFYIELGVSVLSLAVVLITSLRFTSYVKSTVKNIVGSIKGINEDYLEKFSCPVAVVGRQGDIVWCNSRFRKAMCGGKGAEGDNIKAYLSGKEIDCLKRVRAVMLPLTAGNTRFIAVLQARALSVNLSKTPITSRLQGNILLPSRALRLPFLTMQRTFPITRTSRFPRQCSILKFACKSGLSSIRLFTKKSATTVI